eukprot:11251453-Alexandrium_andersonii.AAC.1
MLNGFTFQAGDAMHEKVEKAMQTDEKVEEAVQGGCDQPNNTHTAEKEEAEVEKGVQCMRDELDFSQLAIIDGFEAKLR